MKTKFQIFLMNILFTGPIPGCKPCTRQEMTYCKDGSVIADHCCCDSSYNGKIFFEYFLLYKKIIKLFQF